MVMGVVYEADRGVKVPGEGWPPALSLPSHCTLSVGGRQLERLLYTSEGSSKVAGAKMSTTYFVPTTEHTSWSKQVLILCRKVRYCISVSMVPFDEFFP